MFFIKQKEYCERSQALHKTDNYTENHSETCIWR